MIIFPAIDLKDGQCVRLKKGDMEQATIFNDNPAAQASSFEKDGFEWIHIVDLNGAFEGKPVNSEAVESIIDAVNIPVQLGGGIRSLETIEHWLEAGVSRVILGTVALRDPELVKKACSLFSGKIAVGIDAKGGKVAVQGWAEDSTVDVESLSLKFEDAGVACIIYTDINRDGILAGPDLEGTKRLAQAITTPVIASGGISSLDDIVALKELETFGVMGAITGRAIYDGKFSSEDVLRVA
ncbi:MAG: 1-(5-phosphoribosyl)-5-[(5-phosphoribosylamino)methylideneamino]imidazole-4-carboxamide isomerase [Rickettsiales bacterium]|nr:1-(5-phosphoribosyl)-5-[(5-phosphoribosylamino)methylideneamino]imidazole-4-carboxamide isomerase [Rickettsiales bacterium]